MQMQSIPQYHMRHHRSIATIAILAPVILTCISIQASAQSACDSCATVKSLFGKWQIAAASAADAELWLGEKMPVVGHVRRLSRETIYIDGLAAQGLHVWYGAGALCRDTL